MAANDFHKEIVKIQSAAASFTKADGTIVQLMLPQPVHLEPEKNYMISSLIKVGVSCTFCSCCRCPAGLDALHVLGACMPAPCSSVTARYDMQLVALLEQRSQVGSLCLASKAQSCDLQHRTSQSCWQQHCCSGDNLNGSQ